MSGALTWREGSRWERSGRTKSEIGKEMRSFYVQKTHMLGRKYKNNYFQQQKGHSPAPPSSLSSLVSPSSPFYQLSPLLDLFTPRPGTEIEHILQLSQSRWPLKDQISVPAPPVEPSNHRPPFSIKSFYSTNAVAEAPHPRPSFPIEKVQSIATQYNKVSAKQADLAFKYLSLQYLSQDHYEDSDLAPPVRTPESPPAGGQFFSFSKTYWSNCDSI